MFVSERGRGVGVLMIGGGGVLLVMHKSREQSTDVLFYDVFVEGMQNILEMAISPGSVCSFKLHW